MPHHVIKVTSLWDAEDVSSNGCKSVQRTVDANRLYTDSISGVPSKPTSKRGCTLRAALLLANLIKADHVAILLPSGRISIVAPLPLIEGRGVHVGGSSNKVLRDKPGLVASPATTLDGDGRWQLLGTAAGSNVHIFTLRFLNGGGESREGGVALGGAIHARGRLTLQNVDMRKNRADCGHARRGTLSHPDPIGTRRTH